MNYMQRKINISTDSAVSLLVAISPILHMYQFVGVVTLGEVFLVVATVISLTTKKSKPLLYDKVSGAIVGIIAYFGVVTLVNTLLLNNMVFTPFKEYAVYIVYMVLILFISRRINIACLFRAYKTVACLVACFVLLQYLSLFLSGKIIAGLIPGLNTYYGIKTDYFIENAARPYGFFTEPAYCAVFLSIPLIDAINNLIESKKIVNFQLVICLLALIAIKSGNAIAIIGYAFIRYLMYCFTHKGISNIKKAVVMSVAGAMIICFAFTLPEVQALFSRVSELSGNGPLKSGYMRMVRGFVVFMNFSLLNKFFGVGFGNYEYLVNNKFYSIAADKTDSLLSWLNGAQTYLVIGGFIGIFLLFRLFFVLNKKWKISQKNIFLLYLILIFISDIFCNPNMVLFFCIFISDFQNDYQKNEPRQLVRNQ